MFICLIHMSDKFAYGNVHVYIHTQLDPKLISCITALGPLGPARIGAYMGWTAWDAWGIDFYLPLFVARPQLGL